MRKNHVAGILCITVVFILLLCGCTQVVNSPADELKASNWQGVYDNGTQAGLEFGADHNAVLTLKTNDGKTVVISGGCIVNDETFMITDPKMGEGFTAGYKLHGDSVEITYHNNVVKLNKMEKPTEEPAG